MIEAAGSRLYGVTEICLLCMVVRHVILVAIVVMSLFNYILPLQICNARVTRPFLFMRRGGRARLSYSYVTVQIARELFVHDRTNSNGQY